MKRAKKDGNSEPQAMETISLNKMTLRIVNGLETHLLLETLSLNSMVRPIS